VEISILVGAGAFGAVFGSFLNVVIYRLPREGESIVRPRSRCVGCGRPIAWYDNIPVLSYLALRGRCRACGARVSLRYPLVEILTAALTVLLAERSLVAPMRASGIEALGYAEVAGFVVEAAFLYAMIAATFIDLDHTIIPDEITKPGMALAVVAGLAVPQLHATSNPLAGLMWAAIGVVTGAGFIWGVRVLGRLAFRKEAMGFGDVKYMGLIGGVLGWKGVFLTFFLACIAGSVIGVIVLLFRRSRYIPFAPFLSLGATVMLLFSQEVMKFMREDYPALIRGIFGG
jgi:leader peptidase (prepilin peptidase)/N-methyltransferase